MRKVLFSLIVIITATNLNAQMKPEETEDWSNEPEIVTPGSFNRPPSDAIILYQGIRDVSYWVQENGEPLKWIATDTSLTVRQGAGGIKTVRAFGSCQLHIEWKSPVVVSGSGQGRGNSGILMMGKYELQVLDSWENKTYSNGQAGSIYKQFIPLVNASLGPGKWQTYDVVFIAPRFNTEGELMAPATFTVFHNGVLIQNHVILRGPTEYRGIPVYKPHDEKLPLSLQEHGCQVSYRNIWIREL